MKDFTLRFTIGYGCHAFNAGVEIDIDSFPMSHDTLRVFFGQWYVACRRARRHFQINEEQHSSWLLVGCHFPFFKERRYRGGWLNEYCGCPPPLEDIKPGFADMRHYEPS